jgi:hypothetical protein
VVRAVTLTTGTGTAATVGTVGTPVTAAVEVDPAGAALTYRWTIDGTAIDGADGPTWTPTAAQVGRSLAVEVTATADGFLAATTRTATPVVVGAAGSGSASAVSAATGGSAGAAAATRLSTTGAATLPVLLVALVLTGAGTALVVTRRRARTTR